MVSPLHLSTPACLGHRFGLRVWWLLRACGCEHFGASGSPWLDAWPCRARRGCRRRAEPGRLPPPRRPWALPRPLLPRPPRSDPSQIALARPLQALERPPLQSALVPAASSDCMGRSRSHGSSAGRPTSIWLHVAKRLRHGEAGACVLLERSWAHLYLCSLYLPSPLFWWRGHSRLSSLETPQQAERSSQDPSCIEEPRDILWHVSRLEGPARSLV